MRDVELRGWGWFLLLALLAIYALAGCTRPRPEPDRWEVCRWACARDGHNRAAAVIGELDGQKLVCLCVPKPEES